MAGRVKIDHFISNCQKIAKIYYRILKNNYNAVFITTVTAYNNDNYL